MCRNGVVKLLQDLGYLLRQSIDALLWSVKSGACYLLCFTVQHLYYLYDKHHLSLHAFTEFYKIFTGTVLPSPSCDARKSCAPMQMKVPAGSLQSCEQYACGAALDARLAMLMNQSSNCSMLVCIWSCTTLISSCLIPC